MIAELGQARQFGGTMRFLIVSLIIFSFTAAHLKAEVKANGLFTDGAVLQRNIPVPVWGTADDGEKVTVKFQGQEVSTVAKGGRWMVKLKPLKAAGSGSLVISGPNNTVTLTNILTGEVWLCSGQSNMGFQLYRAANAAEALAAAADDELRLYTVPRQARDEPQPEVTGNWKISTPGTVSNFSAVAYFFGRDLRRALKVPVGLIDSSVGGTPAEAWTSRETLEKNPELASVLTTYAAHVKAYDPQKAEEKYKRDVEKHTEVAMRAKAEGKTAPRPPVKPNNPARANGRPSGLYNAMIAPLEPYGLAGVIWYQGEANSGRAEQYKTLFPAMIRNWREDWAQPKLPFLFVEIAPNSRMTPEIREAQLLTWQKDPHTAMAVITDVGDANDIHPTKKEPVGARLALAARAIAYGEKIEFSGPVFEKLKIRKDKAILRFTHTGGGLVAKDGPLKGFTIAGADKVFVPAEAFIKGDDVIVSALPIKRPVAVRYGWDNVPDVNLFNAEGLPATPFRTDVK
jgi:sialate O-acetylesterase